MTIQNPTFQGIPPGFGLRLKDERKRLGLSQADLADVGGVQRLTQVQYEAEATAPTTRYLSAISVAGIDLSYLILNMRFGEGGLTPAQMQRVEGKTFDWIKKCAASQSDGRLSPDTHQMLFKLFRGYLTQVELGQLPADFDPAALIAGQVAVIGKK